MRGLTMKPKPVEAPSPVVDLMAASKRSLVREAGHGDGGEIYG